MLLMTATERSREDHLRRQARRQGLLLRKSRAREWTADDHCGYRLIDERNVIVAGERFDLSLDEVEASLADV